MRVAIFTDNDFEKVNGVTTTLRAVLEHAPDELDVRIYTCDGIGIDLPEDPSLPAFGVGIPFYREMKVYLPPFGRLLRHAIADGVDLVHLTTPGPVGLAALWVASRLGVRMVGSFHTDLAAYARHLSGSQLLARLTREVVRWPYERCERVFAPSEATRDLLIHAKLDPCKIEIWRRGVSTTQFDPAKRSTPMRERWGASAAEPVIMYVGRLSREKNLALLQPLSRHLHYAGIRHRLVWVGDGPMRTELEASCPTAIFTGTLAPDQVAVAMASADLFVFPSETDTAGNVVLEAQASGLPVLVSRRGGPHENMIAAQTGYVCGDVGDFTRRAADLLRNPRKRQEFGERARRYASARSWETALEPLDPSYLAQPRVEGMGNLKVQTAAAR